MPESTGPYLCRFDVAFVVRGVIGPKVDGLHGAALGCAGGVLLVT